MEQVEPQLGMLGHIAPGLPMLAHVVVGYAGSFVVGAVFGFARAGERFLEIVPVVGAFVVLQAACAYESALWEVSTVYAGSKHMPTYVWKQCLCLGAHRRSKDVDDLLVGHNDRFGMLHRYVARFYIRGGGDGCIG